MNARRSPGSSSVQSVRWLASEPPFVSETFSARRIRVPGGDVRARLVRPLRERVSERGLQERLGVGVRAEQVADRHRRDAGLRQVVVDEVPVQATASVPSGRVDVHEASCGRGRRPNASRLDPAASAGTGVGSRSWSVRRGGPGPSRGRRASDVGHGLVHRGVRSRVRVVLARRRVAPRRDPPERPRAAGRDPREGGPSPRRARSTRSRSPRASRATWSSGLPGERRHGDRLRRETTASRPRSCWTAATSPASGPARRAAWPRSTWRPSRSGTSP